jgi:hypothetical protein
MKHAVLILLLGMIGCSEIPVAPSQVQIHSSTLAVQTSYGTIDSVVFSPMNANKNSLITISAFGTWGTTYTREVSYSDIKGTTITLDVVISHEQNEAQVITSWSTAYQVGRLASGWYTVNVNLWDGTTSQVVAQTRVTLVVKGHK